MQKTALAHAQEFFISRCVCVFETCVYPRRNTCIYFCLTVHLKWPRPQMMLTKHKYLYQTNASNNRLFANQGCLWALLIHSHFPNDVLGSRALRLQEAGPPGSRAAAQLLGVGGLPRFTAPALCASSAHGVSHPS